jgi:8-oxo-dGTP diphosphatase
VDNRSRAKSRSEQPRHVVAVTGFVTNDEGRILLVRVARRGWEMPGGQVEEGEDLVSALRREVAEDSGCAVDVADLVGVYARVGEPALVVLVFGCVRVDGDARPRDDDVLEAGWFTTDDARRLVSQPAAAHRLDDALARREDVVYRTYRLDPYEVPADRVI